MSTESKPYKHTLRLPKTDFPMKADLPASEPKRLELWERESLYERIRRKRTGQKKFVLHDGPPYANGAIHIGHAFNKILKDIIVKYKTMRGFDAPYLPGWDCHGLPIEHALFKDMGKRKEDIPQVEFRKKARAYAQKYMEIQREEFKRLGVFGEWEKPYLTMAPEYQASIAESFLKLYEAGYIERRLKPVPWCYDCETALADAELEYEDKTSPSVYVRFLRKGGAGEFHFLVWTTTPWTLPANAALAVHPDLEYVLVETEKGNFIFASALASQIQSKLGVSEMKRVQSVPGRALEGVETSHPFLDRVSKVVLAGFVSSMDGTGIVHIAPGHGEEDYAAGLKYKLPIPSPVDEKGRFTHEFPEAEGELVHRANQKVIALLKEKNNLLFEEPVRHSYPHCWRCKNPIIFRATEQWFLKVDHKELRKKLGEAVRSGIRFTPEWGKNRIGSMIETRPDWCLSRQRYWGVPIPVIQCAQCGRILVSESKSKIVDLIRAESADVWFVRPENDFLPDGFRCACGSLEFRKESDIIDVWFDSGVSHQAVLKRDPELGYPADLYLEGSDQHRGWFQAALVSGVALDGTPPFRGVLTHGFVVDGEGKKMSKSAGNVVAPQEVTAEFGADVLRLWAAGSDYQYDIRLSHEILTRLVEGYRRIRNTFRFLLGNLNDFKVKTDAVDVPQMEAVDRWAVGKCDLLARQVTQHYEESLFHLIYRDVQDYLVIDLSSFYLDILKDRLYTAGERSRKRRSAQTALHFILERLVRILAPILPFTCDEVWRSYSQSPIGSAGLNLRYGLMGEGEGVNLSLGVLSVHESDWPELSDEWIQSDLIRDWQDLLALRDAVNRKIEAKREAKEIGSSLEVRLAIDTEDARLRELLGRYLASLREAFIVSQIEASPPVDCESSSVALPSDGGSHSFRLRVDRALGKKCERCWNYSVRVGEFPEHAALCERCIEAIGASPR